MTDDIITDLPANVQIEPLKSWRTFRKQFSDAQRLKTVTFCDTPSLLLEFFDKHDLNTMEVVVGDIGDYRERLIGKPDTADRLERLKRDGDLKIYQADLNPASRSASVTSDRLALVHELRRPILARVSRDCDRSEHRLLRFRNRPPAPVSSGPYRHPVARENEWRYPSIGPGDVEDPRILGPLDR